MTDTQTITLSFPSPDVVLLALDMPGKGANVLSQSVLQELEAHLDELEKRDDLAGLIISSGKPGTFIAGADLREFAASLGAAKEEIIQICRRGQMLFSRLSKCPFVTVAAIDGICVGGGAELAIWCDRRVMTNNPKTEFGFPEVKLGLFPGWGGTVRAPRIVGLANAVELITGGESVDAEAARAMGLSSDVVPPEHLIDAAVNVIRSEQATGEFRADRQRWSKPVSMNETELGFLGVTASALVQQKTAGKYPAPMAALEMMLETAELDAESACLREAEGMADLFGTDVNAALLNVFFLNDRIKKDKGIDAGDAAARSIETVGVVGAGIMGAGIAAANVKRKVSVVISDASDEALTVGAKNVLEEVAYDKKTGGANAQRAIDFCPLLNISVADAEMATCDLVIEAVVENADVKRAIFARLEPQLGEQTILASNTSTIPITQLARDLQHPDRFCGIHFFNPVRRMKLVEVIRGEQTSDETVVTAVAYAKRIGKMPIVVNDGPGFIINRLLFPYMNESIELICEGAELQKIDKASTGFGMPMGPIALFDMVGLDTSIYAGRVMWEAFPDRIKVSKVLPALMKAGRLGQKSGRGFYNYENRKKRAEPDPTLQPLLDSHIRDDKQFTREELQDRLFLPMLLEATRAIEERIVRNVRDIDFGLIFGLGFPPFRGGLLHWADTLGAEKIVETLKPYEQLGERYKPTPLLLEMAKDGRKFYQ
ncbi:MAG: enoyl-CoA hydratase/isomerase family protein [Planctomycetes bacterium]|nr:enoyl-CoA hydratase/isomerase family protein [Planctomycetota bacterium]